MAEIYTKCTKIAEDYETINRDDLIPCPFCGDSNPKLIKNNRLYKIFCSGLNCGAQYGWCASEERAVNGWNGRKKVI
jgi:hypothetical protein